MSLPFLHRHMSLTPSLRHLDLNFSYRAKGLSMSCDSQRQKSESTQHFSKRTPNFFCISDIHQTWIQNTFSEKSSSAQLMLYVPSIPSPPHVIDTFTPPSGLKLFLPRQGSIN